MKASKDCYECLQRLAYQAARLATSHEQVRSKAIEKGLKTLKENFSYDKVSIVIATKIHDTIKEVTQNPDPYRALKDKEILLARDLSKQMWPKNSSFKDYLKFAALGNTIDFFRPIEVIEGDMKGQVDFVIDDSERFEAKLGHASKVLYLADNAGEVFFDLPLLRWMRRQARVIYVVKAAPVQDDLTLDDIMRAGVEDELGEVMTTGTATPGIDLSIASAEFRQAFESADLIFAKGMGYYESLSEIPAEGRVLHCLRAKCQPVADSLGVTLNSYVAMLR